MTSQIMPSLGIILSGFLNSLYPIFIRNNDLDLQFKILLRFVSFFIVTYIYLYVKWKTTVGKEKEKYEEYFKNIFSPNILRVSTLNYLYVAGIIVAMQFAPQYITFPLFMCWTIVLVLMEKFYFKRPVTNNQVMYVLLGFLGIVVMNIGEFLNTKSIKYNKIFLVVAGLAAVAHGIFVPFFKEISETTNDPIIDTFYLTGFASILSVIGIFIQHFATKHKIKIAGKWDQIIKLVMFYIIVEGIANYTYYYGLSKLPAINAAVLYNSMVVFGLLIGFFYFKERPTKITISGVLIIIASIIGLQINGNTSHAVKYP